MATSLICCCRVFERNDSRNRCSTPPKAYLSKDHSMRGRLKSPTMRILLDILTTVVRTSGGNESSSWSAPGALYLQATLTRLYGISGVTAHTWTFRVHNSTWGSTWIIPSRTRLVTRCSCPGDQCRKSASPFPPHGRFRGHVSAVASIETLCAAGAEMSSGHLFPLLRTLA